MSNSMSMPSMSSGSSWTQLGIKLLGSKDPNERFLGKLLYYFIWAMLIMFIGGYIVIPLIQLGIETYYTREIQKRTSPYVKP